MSALLNARTQWQACAMAAKRARTPASLAALRHAEKRYCELHAQLVPAVAPLPVLAPEIPPHFKRIPAHADAYALAR